MLAVVVAPLMVFKDLVLLYRYATVEAHAIPAMVHFYNESYAN